jgi:hypothetical protein
VPGTSWNIFIKNIVGSEVMYQVSDERVMNFGSSHYLRMTEPYGHG